MITITPKNWSSFQHYKDRKPSWIKLHRDLLDNYEFHCLPVASRALAPCLWLLASEYDGGSIPAAWGMIAFRLRMSEQEVESAVTPLIEKGFFVASTPLADCKQSACLEKEKEKEREKERDRQTPAEPVTKPGKAKAVTLKTWLAGLGEGQEAIPADDTIFDWSAKVGLPDEFLGLAWQAFQDKYLANGKRYADWRAVFRNAVRDNWLKVWYIRDGQYHLTTVGEQVRRAAA